MASKVSGLGHFVPETIISNEYFIDQGLDTSNEWIVERTGIKQRRFKSKNLGTAPIYFIGKTPPPKVIDATHTSSSFSTPATIKATYVWRGRKVCKRSVCI